MYVYSRVEKKFAIYEAGVEDGSGRLGKTSIWVQYADEGQTAADNTPLDVHQRKALASLRGLRGQIDGYQHKLALAMDPIGSADRTDMDGYNKRVTDALFTALQGDAGSAESDLGAIKADILEQLRSRGRLQFAKWTVYATVITLFVLGLLVLFAAGIQRDLVAAECPKGQTCIVNLSDTNILKFVNDTHLWAAALFGTLGAWFSIALNLRSSQPEYSNNRLDNFVDPALRIVIAVLAACILFSLVRLGLFSISIGDTRLDWSEQSGNGDAGWKGLHLAIFLAFLAGFSERLVGNFLDQTSGRLATENTPAQPRGASATGDETNPLGKGTDGGAGTADGPPSPPGPTTAEDEKDLAPMTQDELTKAATGDADLPPSTGGVEAGDLAQEMPK